jgi:hypothetical protein
MERVDFHVTLEVSEILWISDCRLSIVDCEQTLTTKDTKNTEKILFRLRDLGVKRS